MKNAFSWCKGFGSGLLVFYSVLVTACLYVRVKKDEVEEKKKESGFENLVNEVFKDQTTE